MINIPPLRTKKAGKELKTVIEILVFLPNFKLNSLNHSENEVHIISNCTATNDTVCSRCEAGLVWSYDLSECVRCGPCCSNSVVDLGCSLDHGDPTMACIYHTNCAGDKESGSPVDFGKFQIVRQASRKRV